jgi:hypothetical protein
MKDEVKNNIIFSVYLIVRIVLRTIGLRETAALMSCSKRGHSVSTSAKGEKPLEPTLRAEGKK